MKILSTTRRITVVPPFIFSSSSRNKRSPQLADQIFRGIIVTSQTVIHVSSYRECYVLKYLHSKPANRNIGILFLFDTLLSLLVSRVRVNYSEIFKGYLFFA